MKTVAIYGAGRMGRVLLDILNPIIDVKCFIDGDRLKCGTRIGKIEIISPEQFLTQTNLSKNFLKKIKSHIFMRGKKIIIFYVFQK